MSLRRTLPLVFALIPATLWAQEAPHDIATRVDTQTGTPRTRLDRSRGMLVSEVRAQMANLSGASIVDPVHLVVHIESGLVERVQMPMAAGGAGTGPYGTFYHDLAATLPAGRLSSGGVAARQLVFERHKYQRFTFHATPYGNPVQEQPPVLHLDPLEYEMETGGTLTFDMSATDPDSPVVTIGVVPDHPQADFASTSGLPAMATFTFAPSNGTRGVFVFAFTARDPGGLEDEKHVQIIVNPSNRKPVVEAPAEVSVDEGALLTIPVTASDPDGDPVTVAVAPLPDNAVFIQTAGGLSFAPDYEQAGIYNVVCTAFDGMETSDPKTIQITVNDVAGTTESNELVLVVDPVESPTLVARQRITGTVNAGTNPPAPQTISTSLITGLVPASARQGQTLDVALTGKSSGGFTTHFADGVSSVSFGADIAVNGLVVNSAVDAVANITIAGDAALGTRGVQMQTGDETAVAVPAFHVLEGRAVIRGTLTDPDTGLPIAGAFVSIAGTALAATTAADGSFTLNDVPAGLQTLVINPPDHQLLRIDVEAQFGTPLVLSNLTATATVYDPTAPATVSVLSLLGRGATDLLPVLDREEANQLVRDAILLTGGDQIGVLDEMGVQLNPELAGDGMLTLTHAGVERVADHLLSGQTYVLSQLLFSVSQGLEWGGEGEPPTLAEWIDLLQPLVNEAWADPANPDHNVPLLLFSTGRSVDPPVLAPTRRLNALQAWLFMNSMMVEMRAWE